MKKKVTFAIIVGFVSLIAGLILAGIGFFSGGMTRLEEVATPTEVHKTFTDLKTIKIDFIPHNISIKESSDSDYHVTYANSDNAIFTPLKVIEKDGLLTLSYEDEKFELEGIMQYIGEILAHRKVDVHTITIEIPKGKALERLEGNVGYHYAPATLFIENSHINEIDLAADISLKNVQIDKGTISSAIFTADQSTLRQLKLDSFGNSLTLKETRLEQVEIVGYHELHSSQLTLIGENSFLPSQSIPSTTNLQLTEQSLQDISFNLRTNLDKKKLADFQGYYYEDEADLEELFNQDPYLKERLGEVGIFTAGNNYANLSVKKEGDTQTLTLENKDSKNKLTIDAINATIHLGIEE